jgi:hypothetical protein
MSVPRGVCIFYIYMQDFVLMSNVDYLHKKAGFKNLFCVKNLKKKTKFYQPAGFFGKKLGVSTNPDFVFKSHKQCHQCSIMHE